MMLLLLLIKALYSAIQTDFSMTLFRVGSRNLERAGSVLLLSTNTQHIYACTHVSPLFINFGGPPKGRGPDARTLPSLLLVNLNPVIRCFSLSLKELSRGPTVLNPKDVTEDMVPEELELQRLNEMMVSTEIITCFGEN